MKNLTLKFTDYYITGTADIRPWGGGNACIRMDPFHIKKIDKKTLMENINDGKFGVEKINGAICEIYKNYEGTHKYLCHKYVGKISDNT